MTSGESNIYLIEPTPLTLVVDEKNNNQGL